MSRSIAATLYGLVALYYKSPTFNADLLSSDLSPNHGCFVPLHVSISLLIEMICSLNFCKE